MRAAASLLLLLGRLRGSVSRALPVEMMDQIARAIERFEIDVRAAGASANPTAVAKYMLAATADDVVQNLPKIDNAPWERFSMLTRFFNEGAGEGKFFQELERAKKNSPIDLDLLELAHACLSLGFEGRYRAAGDAARLQKERRDLYETIRRDRPKPVEDLSPHWRGLTIALARSRFVVPVWSVAAIALAILFGVYLFLRGELSARASALVVEMERLHPVTPIVISRSEPVKPPVEAPSSTSSQLRRIRAALAEEIMAKKVDASQTSTRIMLTIGTSSLFSSGGAKVNETFSPLAAKIAKSLDKEPGVIQIDGYTDSDPIKTLAFPSNFELSEARAKSVAAILKTGLAQPGRVRVAGKGEANPVAPNDNESDKSKNRRVEVSIPRTD